MIRISIVERQGRLLRAQSPESVASTPRKSRESPLERHFVLDVTSYSNLDLHASQILMMTQSKVFDY